MPIELLDKTTRERLFVILLGAEESPKAVVASDGPPIVLAVKGEFDTLIDMLEGKIDRNDAQTTKILAAIQEVLRYRQTPTGKFSLPSTQIAHDFLAPQPDLDLSEMKLEGLSADQLRKMIEAKDVDLFKALKADRTFGSVLESVVDKTIENSFKRILKEGAESAVREASLDLLRKCYVSIAAGSKLSDLVQAITKIKPGGGSDGGDPTDGTARMP